MLAHIRWRRSPRKADAAHRLAIAIVLLATVSCDGGRMPLAAPTMDDPLEAKAGGGTTSDRVVSELLGGGTAPNLNLQSDGLGPYYDGKDGVVSIIQGVGDWELDQTARKSTRATRIDLTDPLPGNPEAAPFGTATVKSRFIAKATVLGKTFQGMTGLGSTILSPISLTFAHGGSSYAMRMNSNNHPQTDWALVTCTRVTNASDPAAPCTQWRLTPTGTHDGVSKNVGFLERVTSSGNVAVGNFYFTFDFMLTR